MVRLDKILQFLRRVADPLTVVFLAIVTAAVFYALDVVKERHERRVPVQSELQLRALDEMQTGISELLRFIDRQRTQIEQSQHALDAMRSERDKMRPLVETDRRAIDELFAQQEERNQAAQERERYIGMVIGVVAAIVGAMLWEALMYALGKRRREPSLDNTGERCD